MQLRLFQAETPVNGAEKTGLTDPSFAGNKSRPIHRWVPWIAGFSGEFVQDILRKNLSGRGVVLDPFAGVGTTLIEAFLAGHEAIGFEINPYAALACAVKLNATKISPKALIRLTNDLLASYQEAEQTDRQPVSRPPSGFKTRDVFYSERILKKVLLFKDFLNNIYEDALRDVFRIAFASTMVSYSNYSYEPSLGTRKSAGKSEIEDFPVIETIIQKLSELCRRIF